MHIMTYAWHMHGICRSTRTWPAALPSYHPSQVYTDLGCRVSRIAAGTTEQRAAMLLAQCGLN